MEQTRSIHPDSFFGLSDDEVLSLIHDNFAPELKCLKRAYSVQSASSTSPSALSPSQILFHEQYDEVNRTLVSLLALRWLYNGQYDTFVGSQPSSEKLTRQSFDWMRAFFLDAMDDAQNLEALVISIIINDLGKDAQLTVAYRERTNIDISHLNHDMILLKAVEAGLVPSLDRLPPPKKAAVIRGLHLSAELNFGQLAQAENAPRCLLALQDMRGQSYAFQMHFLEQLLDIAGAAGHLDWSCAKKLIEPILQAYRSVYGAAKDVISSSVSLRDAYDRILIDRARALQVNGFRSLEINNPKDRALMRLLCMGGVNSLETAQLFDGAWRDLEGPTKNILVHALNVDGSPEEPAIQPTYMPALLTQAIDASGLETPGKKKRALQSAFRYLARVMTLDIKWEGQGSVIERNVLDVLKEVVQSPQFRADPIILERAIVPEGVVCNK